MTKFEEIRLWHEYGIVNIFTKVKLNQNQIFHYTRRIKVCSRLERSRAAESRKDRNKATA